jgi:hypothetical protein
MVIGRTSITFFGLFAALSLSGEPAHAQESSDESNRRGLIHEAESASRHGDHARAAELAAQAGRIRMTPSLRLFLAEESSETGRWVQAYTNATLCRSEGVADASLPDRRRLLASCARLEERAAPRVGFIVVRVARDIAGLSVRVANEDLPPALWNARHVVGPGAVAVVALSPDGRRFEEGVQVAAGQTREVIIALPEATPAPVAPVALPARAVVIADPIPVVVTPAPAPAPARGAGPGPWVLAGGGALGLAAAAVSFSLRESAVTERDRACTALQCSDSDEQRATSLDGDARTWSTVTSVALGVGAAAVAGGVVWWLLARPPSRSSLRGWVVPYGERGTLGVAGVF